MTNANNKISTLFPHNVPFFIKEDYSDAVVFFQKYYEFMEQNNIDFKSGYPVERLINHLKNIDVDTTDHDEASQYLYDKFIQDIPVSISADKSILLKYIKDFYRSKGTERATKFLIYALTGSVDVSIYYPKTDILKASDGKWFIQKSLRISNTWINNVQNSNINGLTSFIGQRIIGNNSNASALVENTNRFYEQGTLIDELILSNINGDFENGELIISSDGYQTYLYGGVINSIEITNGGYGYNVGDPVIVTSNIGDSACVVVSAISTGNISSIAIEYSGAGFKTGQPILISGGGGTGANAIVSVVDNTGDVHPNSYNIIISQIGLEGNTIIGNTAYSNLVPSITDPANNSIANSMLYMLYDNVGPIQLAQIISYGTNYTSSPTIDIVSNNIVRSLGILGRMKINDGGLNYSVGNKIEFINVVGGYGTGAKGNVKAVNISGSITSVEFEGITGHYVGGEGYSQSYLPRANVISTTGSGANITVTSILGDGEILSVSGNNPIGSILSVSILNHGINYDSNTTLDFTQSGNGEASGNVSIIEGVYSYPGRFLNDDGFLSSYNFLQDQHYYQPFSYVVRSDVSINDYRSYLKQLGHPIGMKMFGEYILEDETPNISYEITETSYSPYIGDSLMSTFNKYANVVVMNSTGYSIANGDIVYIEYNTVTNQQKNWLSNTECSNGYGDTSTVVSVLGNGYTQNVTNLMPQIFGGNGVSGLRIIANTTHNNILTWATTENISRFVGNTIVFSAYFEFDSNVSPGSSNVVLFYSGGGIGMTAKWNHITDNIWRGSAYLSTTTNAQMDNIGFCKWKVGVFGSENISFNVTGVQLEIANSQTGIATSTYGPTKYQPILGNTWIDDGHTEVSNGFYTATVTDAGQFYFSTLTTNNAIGSARLSVTNHKPYKNVSFIKTANTILIDYGSVHGLSNGSNIYYHTTDFTQTQKNYMKLSEFQSLPNALVSNVSVFAPYAGFTTNSMPEIFGNGQANGIICWGNATSTNVTVYTRLTKNITNTWITWSAYIKMYKNTVPSMGLANNKTLYGYLVPVGPLTQSDVIFISNSVYRISGKQYIGSTPATHGGIIKYGSAANFSDNSTFEITKVQFEIGNVATDYETVGDTWIAANTYITPNGLYSVSVVDSNYFTINTPKQNNAIGHAQIRIP